MAMVACGVAAAVIGGVVGNAVADRSLTNGLVGNAAIGAGAAVVALGVASTANRLLACCGGKAIRPGTTIAPRALPPLRQACVDDFAQLSDEVFAWRRAGADPEFIAREVVANRRALGMKYKDLMPEPLRSQIRDRSLARYQDEWGPTVDWFLDRNDSWEDIIGSSLRPGGGDLGF